MKATGIVRKVDELGRVVLPIELRRTFSIDIKDSIEVYTEGDTIVLRKYQESCYVCGNTNRLKEFKGKNICSECIAESQNL